MSKLNVMMMATLVVLYDARAALIKDGWKSIVPSDRSTTVRVLLDRGTTLEVSSDSIIQVRIPDTFTTRKFKTRLRISLDAAKKNLVLNGTSVPSGIILSSATNLRCSGHRLQHDLHLHVHKGKILAVNHIPLFQYLVGTLSAEVYPSWPEEALKAQAIASRSYAYYMIRYPRHPLYDMESTVIDQVYKASANTRISAAVSLTSGAYLSQNYSPLKAFFHSRCGGGTAAPGEAWGSEQKGWKTASCPFCSSHPLKWESEFGTRELYERFGFRLNQKDEGLSVTLRRNPASQRVMDVTFQLGEQKAQLSAEDLRKLLGYQTIKSTRFKINLRKGRIGFAGAGLGHGVGMCQWGAAHLARTGFSHDDILKHYYPHASLLRIP